MSNKKTTPEPHDAPGICLYGTREHGSGWLAHATGYRAMFGNGELVQHRSFTEAVFQACDALRQYGYTGIAYVFEPEGKRCAPVNVCRPCYFGNLAWQDAPVYTISSDAIIAAAS